MVAAYTPGVWLGGTFTMKLAVKSLKSVDVGELVRTSPSPNLKIFGLL